MKSRQTVAGRVLYDAFGGVLTRTAPISNSGPLTGTLPPGMIDLLAGQASIDPDAGLVYLGNGRYFDPLLGLPLQPNPLGGVPTVPQSLNRYAATAFGQPGVAEGVMNGGGWGYNPIPDAVGAAKTWVDETYSLQIGQMVEALLPHHKIQVNYGSALITLATSRETINDPRFVSLLESLKGRVSWPGASKFGLNIRHGSN